MKLYNKNYFLQGIVLLIVGGFLLFVLPDPKPIVADFNLIWGLTISAGCVMILRSFLDPNKRPPEDA